MRPRRRILEPLDLAYAQLLPVRLYEPSQADGVFAYQIKASKPTVSLMTRVLGPVWVIDWAYPSAIVLATVDPYRPPVEIPKPIKSRLGVVRDESPA